MRKLLLLLTLFVITESAFAQCTSIANGRYNQASTWSCGRVPVEGEEVIIMHRVSVSSTYHGASVHLIITSGSELILEGQLNLGSNTQACNSTLTIEQGGKVSADSPGQNERLRLCGTVVLTGQQNPNGQGEPIPPGGYYGPATFDRFGITTLPVEILFFEGVASKESVQLKWATSFEDKFDFFTVERSADAVNFEPIGSVNGAGYSTTIVNYSFTDQVPIRGRAYYRLKATDFDGSVEYHKIISVTKEANAKLLVQPNPLSGNEFKLTTSLIPSEGSKVKIYNMVGKEVFQDNFSASGYDFILQKPLDPGLYIVQLESGNQKYQTKITVR